MSTKERMEKMRRDMHVFERLSNADCTWCLERIEALEKVVEAARDIVTYGSVEPDKGMDGDTIVDTWRFAVMQDAISALDAKEQS